MDFISDQMYDGNRIRVLTIVENHSRESLAMHVTIRLRGMEVVRQLEAICAIHGKPQAIRVDNGTEFISKRHRPVSILEQSEAGLQPSRQTHRRHVY